VCPRVAHELLTRDSLLTSSFDQLEIDAAGALTVALCEGSGAAVCERTLGTR
jgi:hypothetical protein